MRRTTVVTAAFALLVGLAGCASDGTGTAAPGTGSETASPSDCALVETAIQRAGERATGLADKLQNDVPGAIADINTTVDELQALAESLPEGELKSQLGTLVDQAVELRTLLEESQQSGANGFTTVAQASTKLGEMYTTLEGINNSCGFIQR
ncbi:MAG: hypothetical protein Q4E05_05815 [Pseudoclavibacter sp.]|nr:hypothetical protein [Pseudoclavibacter sp.]